jgi:hypothetical protein
MSFACTAEDMHPYECEPVTCRHCNATKTEDHDPRRCWLCWDGDPDGEPGPLCTVGEATDE